MAGLEDDDDDDLLSFKLEYYRSKIDWPYWHSMGSLKIGEAACLTLNINPTTLGRRQKNPLKPVKDLFEAYDKRFEQLRRACDSSVIESIESRSVTFIKLPDLIEWANRYHISIPDELRDHSKFGSETQTRMQLEEKIKNLEMENREIRNALRVQGDGKLLVFYQMILSMARDKYGYPSTPKSKAINAIATSCIETIGGGPIDDTIEKHLERAEYVIYRAAKRAEKKANDAAKSVKPPAK